MADLPLRRSPLALAQLQAFAQVLEFFGIGAGFGVWRPEKMIRFSTGNLDVHFVILSCAGLGRIRADRYGGFGYGGIRRYFFLPSPVVPPASFTCDPAEVGEGAIILSFFGLRARIWPLAIGSSSEYLRWVYFSFTPRGAAARG